MLIPTLTLLLTVLLTSLNVQSQVNTFDQKQFSVRELQEDFKYMRSKIESKGTVIYLYNTKERTDAYLDSMYACIKVPMTAIEFFRFTAPIQAFIKDVHTAVFPGAAIRKTFFENDHLFPLGIGLIDQKAFIDNNLSGNPNLNVHQQILSVNGIPMETIIEQCSRMLPRDGYDTGHPLFWLNGDFLYYYYFIYGPSETYRLELKTADEQIQTETVQGLSLKTIWENEDKLEPVTESRNVYTTIIDSVETVILTLNTFDDNTIKATHKATFRKLIQAEFDTILKTGYSNLVIDIRNNDGGNSGDGKKVMKYLLKTPFKMKKSVRVVKNKQEEDLMKRTRHALYGQFQRGTYKPHKVGFNGTVYVMVNEGSTSAAVVFAATMRRYNRATFVGTEMGGNPIIMSGGLWDNVKETPNTKISFMYGNKLNILDSPELNTGHGFIPDYVVQKNYEDFVTGTDTQLQFVLKMIVDDKQAELIPK